jgi:hypothetical protein
MLNEDNLKCLEEEKFQYIVEAKLRNVSKNLQEAILSEEHYTLCENNKYFQRIAIFDEKNNRKLLISYSAKRAAKDKYDREKAVEKILKKLSKSKNPKTLLSNYGYEKYLKIAGESTHLSGHSRRWPLLI